MAHIIPREIDFFRLKNRISNLEGELANSRIEHEAELARDYKLALESIKTLEALLKGYEDGSVPDNLDDGGVWQKKYNDLAPERLEAHDNKMGELRIILNKAIKDKNEACDDAVKLLDKNNYLSQKLVRAESTIACLRERLDY
jgi:hypothetical protein